MEANDSYVRIIGSEMVEDWSDPSMFDTAGINPDPGLDINEFIHTDAYGSSPLPGGQPAALAGYASPTKPFAPLGEQTSASLQSQSTLKPRSQVSSSPDSSSQDSASETSGRRKRKMTSSDSSPSVIYDPMDSHMDGYTDDWPKDPVLEAASDGIDSMYVKREPHDFLGLEQDVDSLGKTMASHFDVGSNGSSPGVFNFGSPGQTVAPSSLEQHSESLTIKSRNAPAKDSGFFIGSRDESPMSGMSGSQGASPAVFLEGQSPASFTNDMFQTMPVWSGPGNNSAFQNNPWQNELSPTQPPLSFPAGDALVFPSIVPGTRQRTVLYIHQDGNKSRVETQITIRMTLDPLPPGVTKLHLPTHTISKPKLLAKDVAKAADTLELHTSLVCASAMDKPELLDRALKRAASSESNARKSQPRRPSQGDMAEDDPDDPEKPANGGEVRICQNCVQRERKRAARKRVKKQEDEEAWAEYEYERVIVFNDKEYKDWAPPQPPKPANDQVESEPVFASSAMQVEVPMRIACYCRHQGEKNGFRVIFTMKDYQGQIIAQSMTNPILITDDHKTQGGIPSTTGMPTEPTQPFNPPLLPPTEQPDLQSISHRRPYHSTNDLQAFQSNWTGPRNISRPSNMPSQAPSTAMTPKNLSRQTSPVATQTGPNKKRKSSSAHHHKLTRELTMTTINRVNNPSSPGAIADVMAMATTMPPTSVPQGNAYTTANDPQYMMQPLNIPYPSGPSTPGSNGGLVTPGQRAGSMDNVGGGGFNFYSVPNSAHHSRAPSPSLGRQSIGSYNLASIPPNVIGNPMNLMQSQMDSPTQVAAAPAIYKVTPGEYSKSGGIEISILGSNFSRNMEVFFGEVIATTTTYWNSQLLVSLLPPAAEAGNVTVTIRMNNGHAPPPGPGPAVYFKYVDDEDQRICEMALRILCQKQNGTTKTDDYHSFARHVVSMATTAWSQNGGSMHHRPSGFDGNAPPMDTEEMLLRCLDLVDMDDSPHPPRFNMKNKTGATFLSLACSLGYGRVVAGLLARGANPDTRDRGGYTPLMMAAMHGHSQIVRRLILKGADPMMRSLQGYLASDLATSEEVLNALQRVRSHRRTRSAGSLSFSMRSRASSIASTHSMWESSSPSYVSEVEADYEDEGEESEEPEEISSAPAWVASRRGSTKDIRPLPSTNQQDQPAMPVVAAMNAWRENLSAQINYFQQNMHWNLPNLQLPALPPLPNLPGYQGHPMMRRISSLVPHRSPPRTPSSSGDETATPSGSNSNDYKWKDLFTTPAAPPAYEEIYPENVDKDTDIKKMTVAQAAADHLLDQACAQQFDMEAESSSQVTKSSLNVELGKKSLTKEEQEQVRRAHAQKLKRIRSDRNLFFIWIPLLLIILCAMLRSRLPQLWAAASAFFGAVQERTTPGRIVEVA